MATIIEVGYVNGDVKRTRKITARSFCIAEAKAAYAASNVSHVQVYDAEPDATGVHVTRYIAYK